MFHDLKIKLCCNSAAPKASQKMQILHFHPCTKASTQWAKTLGKIATLRQLTFWLLKTKTTGFFFSLASSTMPLRSKTNVKNVDFSLWMSKSMLFQNYTFFPILAYCAPPTWKNPIQSITMIGLDIFVQYETKNLLHICKWHNCLRPTSFNTTSDAFDR